MQEFEMTSEDISSTFGSGWLGYKKGDIIEPFYVDGGSESRIVGRFKDETTVRASLNDPNLVLEVPDSCMFWDGGLRYFERKAERQYRRGIHANTSFIKKFSVGDGEPRKQGCHLEWDILHALFNQQPSKGSSVLLSPRLAVLRPRRGKSKWCIYMGDIVSNRDGVLKNRYKYLEDYFKEALCE